MKNQEGFTRKSENAFIIRTVTDDIREPDQEENHCGVSINNNFYGLE